MRLAQLLRLTVLGIAVLGWLDPPVMVAPLPPVAVSVAVARSAMDAAPAANDARISRREAVDAVVAGLVSGLGADGDVRTMEFDEGGRLPCGAQEPCVVVTAGSSATVRVPNDRTGPTSLVRVGDRLAPNASIVSADIAPSHIAAEGTARVTLDGRGLAGRVTRVRLTDAGAVAGEATLTWTEDGPSTVTVPWWPLESGIRAVAVDVVTEGAEERTSLDNRARAMVDVTSGRWPVLVYERRPSWATTFVRRALESDPRFDVLTRTDIAPAVTAGTAGDRLSDGQLDRARLVVAGSLDALTQADVTRLDVYVRERGGTLVLAPDRAPTGSAALLLSHRWTEQLLPAPTEFGGLRASEWLVADDVTPLDDVWARTAAGPTIVATPHGAGRIVMVGAMDAWRHRSEGVGYDRFWRGRLADLARASSSAVGVSVSPRWLRPGDQATVIVRGRSMRRLVEWRASASIVCGERSPAPVRLWPTDAAGTFEGVVQPPGDGGSCVIAGAIEGVGEGRTSVLVTPDADGEGRRDEVVEAAVTRTSGISITPAELDTLLVSLRQLRNDERKPEARYPMRSAWWLLPLVACLAGEWWLRRRAGLR